MGKNTEMPKAFDSQSVETKLYEQWEKNGFFKPETLKQLLTQSGKVVGKPFTITLPPPNANGELHLGHTCGYSFHDAMGRFNRMMGRPTLLLPGKDHASIQTETVYTKILKEQGIDKWELGREKFYQMCYEFCMEKAKGAQIQERRIGLSADWERDFFTLDPRLTEVIYETFFKMYEEGLVYRKNYIINQCPFCRTALADIDTVHKEMRGIFAYIIYPFVNEADNDLAEKELGTRGIMIATSRPETMLADTAVAVNPDDARYIKFVGKMLKLPIVGREIPIIADEAIDLETGTGALKVTPAHAQTDFEIAERHDLPIINIINEEGKMYGDIPERFKGLNTVDCSKAICAELKELGLLDKLENIKHEVAVCERCGTPIEPIVSDQWFVNVKPLAEKALEAIDKGEVKVIPEGQQSALVHFYKNIRPWCISRQQWWGQRIPIWYSGGKKLFDWLNNNPDKTVDNWESEFKQKARGSGKAIASDKQPETDPDWKGDPKDLWLEAEEDIFDTWFSSGQWPYSTLGGIKGEDFKKFYPTNVMAHARDILFWWSARMIMFGLYRTDQVPFNTVFLHGLIMAPDGSKMSKSKGNGVPPQEIFDKYGADPLRMWYYSDAIPGANPPLREEKIKGNRNFINKIWNASRYVLMNLDESELDAIAAKLPEFEEKFGNRAFEEGSRLAQDQSNFEKVIKYMEDFKFHLAAEQIREHFWGNYCDIWIEEVKKEIADTEVGSEQRITALAELVFMLKQNLKIMHPMIPYITEAVWQELVEAGFAQNWLIVEQY